MNAPAELFRPALEVGDPVRVYERPGEPDMCGCYAAGYIVETGEYPGLGLKGQRYKVYVTQRYWMSIPDSKWPIYVYPAVDDGSVEKAA